MADKVAVAMSECLDEGTLTRVLVVTTDAGGNLGLARHE